MATECEEEFAAPSRRSAAPKPWENAKVLRPEMARGRRPFFLEFSTVAAEATNSSWRLAGPDLLVERPPWRAFYVFRAGIRRCLIFLLRRIAQWDRAGTAARAECKLSRPVPSWPRSNRQMTCLRANGPPSLATRASVLVREDHRGWLPGVRLREQRCHRARRIFHQTRC